MLDILEKAARTAGQLLLKYFKTGIAVDYKNSHQTLLTKADIKSQNLIKKIITQEMVKKDHKRYNIGFIGEENLNYPAKNTFVIDPLDGTTNFASNIDFFGISIAYFKESILTASIFYQPAKNHLYWAAFKKGAFKNGRKLKIIYRDLKDCLVDTYISTDPQFSKQGIKIIDRLHSHVRSTRIFGSALGLCLLAENLFNIYYETGTNLWDIASAKLIIEESGGLMVDFRGKPVIFDLKQINKKYQIISCHRRLLPQILKFFTGY